MTAITLRLDPGEKGLIGSMVVTNTHDHVIELTIEGEGPVIRGKHIITPEEAISPSLKIYYMVTAMYMVPEAFEEGYKTFLMLARELLEQIPSTGLIMAEIGDFIIEGDFRSAHEMSLMLLEYEDHLIKVATGEESELFMAAFKGGDATGDVN